MAAVSGAASGVVASGAVKGVGGRWRWGVAAAVTSAACVSSGASREVLSGLVLAGGFRRGVSSLALSSSDAPGTKLGSGFWRRNSKPLEQRLRNWDRCCFRVLSTHSKPPSSPRSALPRGVDSASLAMFKIRSGTARPVRNRATSSEKLLQLCANASYTTLKRRRARRRYSLRSASVFVVVPKSRTSQASIGTASPTGLHWMLPAKKYSSLLLPQSTTTVVCGTMSNGLPAHRSGASLGW